VSRLADLAVARRSVTLLLAAALFVSGIVAWGDLKQELLPDVHAALAGMTQYEIAVPLAIDAEPGKLYRAYVKSRLDKVGLSEPLQSILFFSSIWDVETEWSRGYLTAP